ncbi:MAG: hypothetical protein ACLQUY_20540 [Ktedonobacterales bacterium]
MNERHFTDDALDDQLHRFYQDVYDPVEPASAMWNKLAPRLDGAQPPRNDALMTMLSSARASRIRQTTPYAGSIRQWLGSAVALLATGVIILASVALFHAFRGHGSLPANNSMGQSLVGCPSAATHVTLPHNASIWDMALTSPTSGWAVGWINSAQYGSPQQSLILQFKNCQWTPAGPTIPETELYSISMAAPDEGWIVGDNVLLHLVAGHWQAITIPLAQAATASYRSVHMLSATEGWIIAYLPKTFTGQVNEILFHLHAGVWSAVTPPLGGVDAVMPIAPNDAWISTGTEMLGQTSQLYHYLGGTWTEAPVPTGMTIFRLHLNAPADAWATGAVPPPGGASYDESPALLHFDGATWSPVALNTLRSPAQDLEMLSADDGWAVGQTYGSALPQLGKLTVLQRYVAGTWQKVVLPPGTWQTVTLPGLSPPLSAIDPIVCATADDCWAIGRTQFEIDVTQGPASTSSAFGEKTSLLHYVAGQWTVYPSA